jgi:hypothetical protein
MLGDLVGEEAIVVEGRLDALEDGMNCALSLSSFFARASSFARPELGSGSANTTSKPSTRTL